MCNEAWFPPLLTSRITDAAASDSDSVPPPSLVDSDSDDGAIQLRQPRSSDEDGNIDDNDNDDDSDSSDEPHEPLGPLGPWRSGALVVDSNGRVHGFVTSSTVDSVEVSVGVSVGCQ